MIVYRKLKEHELSIYEIVQERVRILFNIDKEYFYGQCGRGYDIIEGFLMGLWIGLKDDPEVLSWGREGLL